MRDADVRALFAIYGGTKGGFGPLMALVSFAGGGWGLLALVPVLWHAATRRFGAVLAATIAVQAAVVWATKLAVGRVRPWIAFGLPPPFDAPHDGSFPSGHAAGCFCVVGFLAAALPAAWPEARARARWSGGAAAAMAAIVAGSRVYLGAHYVSDVVGGALIGGVLGTLGGRAYRRGRLPSSPDGGTP